MTLKDLFKYVKEDIVKEGMKYLLVDSKYNYIRIPLDHEEYKAFLDRHDLSIPEVANKDHNKDMLHDFGKESMIVIKLNDYSVPSANAIPAKIPYQFLLKDIIDVETEPGRSVVSMCLYEYVENVLCVESSYLHTVKRILSDGEERGDRTGTGTVSVFGNMMRFDISEYVPLLTTKFVPWRACIHELLWFLRGCTDSKELEAVKVNIWKDNTSKDFLEKRGLGHLPEGDIGAGYGFQWRHFGAKYTDCHTDYTNQGVDQIKEVIRQLKEEPTSRRILFSAWNPSALNDMALPPCHVMCQFYVSFKDDEKYLSCQMYQRSQDVFLGAPFNIFSYTVLTHLLAKMTGMKPKELIITSGDTHIYKDHVEQMREQVTRSPLTPPRLRILDSVLDKTVDEISIEDFVLEGYMHHAKLYGKMSV